MLKLGEMLVMGVGLYNYVAGEDAIENSFYGVVRDDGFVYSLTNDKLEQIPNVFLMAILGVNPYDQDIIDSEYDKYRLYNPNSSLGRAQFKTLFRENVIRYK